MNQVNNIIEFSFSFSELAIDPTDITILLGYPDGILPEPFAEYLSEAMKKAENFSDLRGAIHLVNDVCFPEEVGLFTVQDTVFTVGKTVARELRNSDSVALFACTAGKEISDLAQNLIIGDNPVLGYVYDVLGSVTVEAVSIRIHGKIREMANSSGELITNRYSPGYCQWSVADQHKLFSFFPENCCGISLTDSALMYPIKSISGIIGMGKKVKYRQYTCDLCNLTDCFYRNRKKDK